MLQKWPRSSCYVSIVAKHLAQKIILHLQVFKDRGKLFKATPSDINISEEAEKSFERMLTAIGGSLPHSKGIADTITVSIFGALDLTTMTST